MWKNSLSWTAGRVKGIADKKPCRQAPCMAVLNGTLSQVSAERADWTCGQQMLAGGDYPQHRLHRCCGLSSARQRCSQKIFCCRFICLPSPKCTGKGWSWREQVLPLEGEQGTRPEQGCHHFWCLRFCTKPKPQAALTKPPKMFIS